jgi:hypothetical protein
MRELTSLIGPTLPALTDQQQRHIRPKFGRYYGDPLYPRLHDYSGFADELGRARLLAAQAALER